MSSFLNSVGTYLPSAYIDNCDRVVEFQVDRGFLETKTGMMRVVRRGGDESVVSMCLRAWNDLVSFEPVDIGGIGALIVVTQNPDSNIPHTSARLQGELNLPEKCFTFDLSLGCSGFVAALSVANGLIATGEAEKALIFTCDPYSAIVDSSDKNTALLFGDGASVSLVSNSGMLRIGPFDHGTRGDQGDYLRCDDGVLKMRGKAIFNFAATCVPLSVQAVLNRVGLGVEDIDIFAFHQGSRFIVDTLKKRLGLPESKVPFCAAQYGNLVSSSIPFLLRDVIRKSECRRIIVSGFGVGLCWSTCLLERE